MLWLSDMGGKRSGSAEVNLALALIFLSCNTLSVSTFARRV